MTGPENPPAFPRDERFLGRNGMTLRDWFAGQALVSIVETHGCHGLERQGFSARLSYQMADAMLAERTKGQSDG